MSDLFADFLRETDDDISKFLDDPLKLIETEAKKDIAGVEYQIEFLKRLSRRWRGNEIGQYAKQSLALLLQEKEDVRCRKRRYLNIFKTSSK